MQIGLDLPHQLNQINSLELGIALFQRGTESMGAKWPSTTEVTIPDLVREVSRVIMAGMENQKEDTQRGGLQAAGAGGNRP